MAEPAIDEDVTGFELDREVKTQLRTLSKENAVGVGQHLVMAGRLLEVDPDTALKHAQHAVRRAGRVPAAREALGLVHYHQQEWAKALAEFRTARRLSGSNHLLPFMVDCERGLGRLDKALELAASPEADALPPEDRIELLVVMSGIRRDQGNPQAAKVTLEVPALQQGVGRPWFPRLAYAYAEALLATGDEDGARDWFAKAAQYDEDGETDADDRLAELDGYELVDLLEGEDDDEDGDDDTDDETRDGHPDAGDHDEATEEQDAVEELDTDDRAGELGADEVSSPDADPVTSRHDDGADVVDADADQVSDSPVDDTIVSDDDAAHQEPSGRDGAQPGE